MNQVPKPYVIGNVSQVQTAVQDLIKRRHLGQYRYGLWFETVFSESTVVHHKTATKP